MLSLSLRFNSWLIQHLNKYRLDDIVHIFYNLYVSGGGVELRALIIAHIRSRTSMAPRMLQSSSHPPLQNVIKFGPV